METQRFESAPFNISGGKFSKILIMWHLRKWWWTYALPVALCLGLALGDVRFLLVALMMIFIMTPMAIFFVYANYGLDKVNRYNVMQKTLAADPAGITLTIDPKYGLKNPVVTIPWHDISNRQVKSKCLLLNLQGVRHRFIAIPFTAFANKESLQSLITILDQHTPLI